MSASKLLEIYEALKNYEVLVDNAAIPSLGLEFNGTINKLPVRVLSPLNDRSDGRSVTPLTFGGASTLQWVITDLCLFASLQSGSSLEYYMPKLVKYQAAYVSNIFSQRTLGITPKTVAVERADIEIGIYDYPINSDKSYFGAKATWTIRENL